ncbi:MAG: proline dehydrogenase family protein [Bacteroidota bacterium]|nr:proline dehydrogenase family protein [Bacteroidota bacterium]MDP4211873.1 proline dehydrogenase family protein [Bacteroidota bacterium]
MIASPVSFNDTQVAFAYKTDAELKKARFLFRSMGNRFLVKWGIRLTPPAIRAGLPIKGIIRNTLFAQFVGGETLEQTASVARKLAAYRVQAILDYGVEGGDNGEAGFDQACDEFIRVIHYASSQVNIPFISIKITGFARFELLEKLDSSLSSASGSLMKRYQAAKDAFAEAELAEWSRVEQRMQRICEAAAAGRVGILVDAEETWIQDPVDVLSIRMMEKFNKQEVIVYNTVQLYRRDRLSFLKDMLEAALMKDFVLGVKLVRGAYMEKERARAETDHYPSPIQEDKEATDRDYNASVVFCLDHIDHISAIIASHNEYSNGYATQLMRERELPLNHKHIHFSQLYGMSDNITFNLAKAGCSVSKYLPFGPIEDVVPYLMRRAEENSSLSGQTGRELAFIQKELQRRRGHR